MSAQLKDLTEYRDKLAQLARIVDRRRARTDLFFLLTDLCGREDMNRQWIMDRCNEVNANPDGYIDLWSRDHYKSSVITFGMTIQDILSSHGDDPDPKWRGREVTVGIFSHSRPIATGFLRQIKQELAQNERLKDLFPDILYANPEKDSPKWSEDGIIVKRKTNPKEATVEAWGVVEAQPTSKHFLVMVYDDVVTRESVSTPEMIAKTTAALELSYSLSTDGGKRRFVGTRYHFNDSYKTVMDRGTAIPRIHAATDDGTPAGLPVLLSPEKLAEKRRDMGPYTFACFVAGTQILGGDWKECAVETLRVGDTVVGYSFGDAKSALVPSKVVAIGSRMAEVVRMTFASGRQVVCTPEHKFFTGRRGADVGGTDTHSAYSQLGFAYGQIKGAISVYDPVALRAEHDPIKSAWLSGIFDGEGSVSSNTITISQSPGHNPQVCERIEQVLHALDYDYGTHDREHVQEGWSSGRIYYLRGGRQAKMRFLRNCDPVRGYKIIDALYASGTRNFGKINKDKLVRIDPMGVQKVFTMQTETGNYVADGYAVKNCQMLLNPTADETQGFKEEWLRFYDTEASSGTNRYLLIDPASGKRPTNDYTSAWVIGLGEDQNYYVLDLVRDRLNLTQRAKMVMELHRKWTPTQTRYEKYGMQADIEHLKTVMESENYRFDITEVGGQTAKTDRIKRLIPLFEQGRVYLPRTRYRTNYEGKVEDLVDVFVQHEYKPFPVSLHDDMLDALARIAEPTIALSWPQSGPAKVLKFRSPFGANR